MIVAMAAIMGLCGYSLGGWIGLGLAIVVAVFIIIATGRASASLVLKMYKAQPLTQQQAPGLLDLFGQLVARADLEFKPTLYYVPSKMMNAFATGRGDQVAVAITDGILRNMNSREIAGVLAHEISHIRHNDVFVMSLADAFSRVTAFIGQIGFVMIWIAIPSALMGVQFPWVAALIFLLAPNASALLQLALSRSREYDADEGAAQITGDPLGLAMALKKIDYAHGNWLQKVLLPGRKVPEPALLRTHPPTQERIDKLKAIAGIDPQLKLPEPSNLVAALDPRIRIQQPRWHLTGLWF